MTQSLFIGGGAGLASALLIASVISGQPLALLLFYLAPLPVAVARLGWTRVAGLTAVVVAVACLAPFLGLSFTVVYLVAIGGPAYWLAGRALLNRVEADETTVEWYPPGRLVLWAAALAAAGVAAALISLDASGDGATATLRRTVESMFREVVGSDVPTDSGAARDLAQGPLIDWLANLIPPSASVVLMCDQVVNLWLAGQVVRISKLLPRPWPPIAALSFPPVATVVLAMALGLSFLPGTIGQLALVIAAPLLVAFAVLGFAVLHMLTRPLKARAALLTAIYMLTALSIAPLLIAALLGVAENLLGLRARFGPPAPPVTNPT